MKKIIKFLFYTLCVIFLIIFIFFKSIYLIDRNSLIKSSSKIESKIKKDHLKCIKLMTYNIAHGRYGLKFPFDFKSLIKTNLDNLNIIINKYKPDFLALQESEEASIISPFINQVKYISNKTYLNNYVHGIHVKFYDIAYGTSILSHFKHDSINSHIFKFRPIALTKGFTHILFDYKYYKNLKLNIISLHLNPINDNLKLKELTEVIFFCKKNPFKTIIMGDFNTDFFSKNKILQKLSKELNLKTFKPFEKGLETHPFLKKRLDWIFIPDNYEFKQYKVIKTKISDHYGVFAEVMITEKENT